MGGQLTINSDQFKGAGRLDAKECKALVKFTEAPVYMPKEAIMTINWVQDVLSSGTGGFVELTWIPNHYQMTAEIADVWYLVESHAALTPTIQTIKTMPKQSTPAPHRNCVDESWVSEATWRTVSGNHGSNHTVRWAVS